MAENKKYVIDSYKAVSQALVLLQSSERSLRMEGKKQQRINSSAVTQIL
jgi:hypothetical protein